MNAPPENKTPRRRRRERQRGKVGSGNKPSAKETTSTGCQSKTPILPLDDLPLSSRDRAAVASISDPLKRKRATRGLTQYRRRRRALAEFWLGLFSALVRKPSKWRGLHLRDFKGWLAFETGAKQPGNSLTPLLSRLLNTWGIPCEVRRKAWAESLPQSWYDAEPRPPELPRSKASQNQTGRLAL